MEKLKSLLKTNPLFQGTAFALFVLITAASVYLAE
jgi:hypothetical protein